MGVGLVDDARPPARACSRRSVDRASGSGRCGRGRDPTGLASTAPVTLVGSHDTASAVVAVPAEGDDAAYIACGTWGLVGVELEGRS